MPLPTITASPPAPNRLLGNPNTFNNDAFAFADYIAGLAGQLNAYATALVAVVSGTDFNASSVTSLTIGTGTKAFAVGTGKLYQTGQFVIAASAANPANFMYGQVFSYAASTLTITVAAGGTGGSGTFADWKIGIAPAAAGYATLNGAETLTGKTIPFASNSFTGTLALVNGGSGQASAPASLAALLGFATTATAVGTTTLTNTSAATQIFTGATTQTVALPVVSTLALGWRFTIVNRSTGALTVNSSGGNLVATISAGVTWVVTCILITGTSAASWDALVAGFASNTGTGANVQALGPEITDPIWTGTPRQDVFPITDAAGFAIDPRNGSIQTITLGANRTPVAANFNDGDEVDLLIDDGAGFAITWTTIGVTHIGGTAPALLGTGYTALNLKKLAGVYYLRDDTPRAQAYGISYVGGGTTSGVLTSAFTASISLTSLTGGLGSAPQVNDLVIVTVAASSVSDLNVEMTSSGWTEHQDLYAAASSTDANLAIYYKKMSGSPDTAFQLNIPVSDSHAYAVVWQVFRGVDTVTPLDTTSTTANATASVLVNPAAITPVTSPNCLVICGAAGKDFGGADTFTAAYLSNFRTAGGDGASGTATAGMGYLRNIILAYDGAAWGYSAGDDTSSSNCSCTMLLRAA